MLNKSWNTLNQAFPEDNTLTGQLKGALGIGIFIFLFLYVFKPFGMHRAGDNILKFSLYFGLITFTLSFVYDLFLDNILRINRQDESWTFGKWLISACILVCLIATGNYYLMSVVLDAVSLSFQGFLSILYSTLLIGLFPIIFFGGLAMTSSRKKYEGYAHAFRLSEDFSESYNLTIEADDGKFIVSTESFLFAEAMQNYVAVYYVNEGQLEKKLLRMRIKVLEKQIGDRNIKRCHRSYIVNKKKIQSVQGNAQGLKLTLSDFNDTVPVSRSYVEKFR